MLKYQKYLLLIILFFVGFFKINVLADSHSVNEILEIIQKDLKTLEKAVYSNSSTINLGNESTEDGSKFRRGVNKTFIKTI